MQSGNKKSHRVAVYIAAVLAASAVQVSQADTPADAAAVAPADAVSEVVVTGTRTTGLVAADSPSPIQILSPEALKAAEGNPDLMAALAQIVPSLTMEAFGFDMAGQTLQARLRGLSPNQVLVLVNGKRRHTTANLAIDAGSPYQGGAGVDLNFIPIEAIDHIEVLTDGAAAQYGTDAIAGVINIILKKNSSGGEVQGTYGKYFDGGGDTGDVDGNVGLEPYEGAYFSLTGSDHNHGHSDVGAPDPRAIGPAAYTGSYPNSNILEDSDFPHVNHIFGDAETHTKLAMFNAGLPINEDVQIYAFGSYGHKTAQSYENYREPTRISCTTSATIPSCADVTGQAETIPNADGTTTTYPYPFGFNPLEATIETDYQLNGGIKGDVAGLDWDVSSSYGADKLDLYTLDSIGNSYPINGLATPINFYDGFLQATQWTTNLDLNRDFDVGLVAPLNVAGGLEYRRETYQIGGGIPDSWEDGGAQSYPGFAPASTGEHARNNKAVYIDLAGKLTEQLRFDAAVRYEDYSDFGSATAGKLSMKYDLTPTFGVRATASNGFRAPTLAEEYYTSTNVGPTTAEVQLPPNSAAGKLVGLGNGLQPEKSVNYSAGIVWRVTPAVMATLDLYQISLTNRITGTGEVFGLVGGVPTANAQLVNNVILASGNQIDPEVQTTGFTVFSNGLDTRTRGVDLTLKVPEDVPVGHIDWTVGATYSQTRLTNTPPTLPAVPGVSLYDLTAISELTTANPEYVVNVGLDWTYDKLSINVLEKLYGPSWDYENDDGDNATNTPLYYRDTIGFTPITNLDIGYQFDKYIKLDIGALNLFNRFPPQVNSNILQHEIDYADSGAVSRYPIFSPFGIDGGFYYAKATITF